MTFGIQLLSRAVIIDQEHILLCKTRGKHQDYFFLPGGHVEIGESAEKALIRELHEEAGCEITVKRFLGIFEYAFQSSDQIDQDRQQEINFVFEASSPLLSIAKPLVCRESHIEMVWIHFGELGNYDVRPAHMIRSTIFLWLDLDMHQALQTEI